ncbi:MAG: hypothetical protein QXV23_04565 [Candidatus Bathyarchaeia archaeon]
MIHENSLLGNVYGVYVTDHHNYAGRIIGNSFLNNVTICFKDTSYFKSWDCYHNNFLGGKIECLRYEPYCEDFWDNGYPSGGNYWSNYEGEDRKSGPEQNLEGSDGIGDGPYRINVAFIDRYPLMEPYGELRPTVYSRQLADGAILRLTFNSIISNFTCNIAARKITFEVYWRSGTKGFAIIDVPRSVFKGEPEVYFDGKTIPFNKSEVDDSIHISFSYEHSKHYVEIRFGAGGGVPPQLSPQNYIVFVVLLIALLLALYLRKRRTIPSKAEPLPPPASTSSQKCYIFHYTM